MSAVALLLGLVPNGCPPAIRTVPSVSRVALCPKRWESIDPVPLKLPVGIEEELDVHEGQGSHPVPSAAPVIASAITAASVAELPRLANPRPPERLRMKVGHDGRQFG